jgi:hypothetical protein
MSIKWSAVKVSEAMDDVERQINLAESFLAEAKVKAEMARAIADLPQYIDQRLIRLTCDIQRIDNVRSAIEAVRQSIPDGAIEAEREHIKNGSQQSLI